MSLESWLSGVVRSGELNRRRPMRTINQSSFLVKIWDYQRMGGSPSSRGYVWMKKWERPGGNGVLFRFEALRVLPENERELRKFRFRGRGVAVEAMLGYNRDYNRRASRLIRTGVSPYYVHRTVAGQMDREGRQMLLSMVTRLACAVAGAAATSGTTDAGGAGLGEIPARLAVSSAGAQPR